MKCPFCGAPLATVAGRCSGCGKDVNLDEALAAGKVEYMLAELDTWADLLPPGLLATLRGRYAERRDCLLARLAGQELRVTDEHGPQINADRHR